MIQTLSDALAERGYDALTPVQEAVTDPALSDADLLVSAQTGSGKTVGFGLAIGRTLLGEAETFGPAAAPLALIVAPTRELAFQVTRELTWLYARTGARLAACVGGMDMRDERRTLERGAHIVVGTPGRLTDHIRRGSLDMGSLRVVVLDEADEMLDLGFREDLEFMLGEAPPERRTLMFSATVPPMIATLAKHYQRDAVRVTTLSDRAQHADIAYQVLQVAPQDAENAIINVLRYHEARNALVFANTRATVNRLTARFANRGFSVVSLSGELSQTERTHALQAMRDGRARVCVATDVAARGIDLPDLELVIHAELPNNAETLLHRSGRTGRAGRKGLSALVVPPKTMRHVERLLKTARVVAEWTTAPGADEILRRDEERLLGDPAWSDALTEDEAAFAERLLAMHGPQAIAAACLRFYRAQHSAPEDLVDPASPAARAPVRERAPFGPGVWFSVSVGREARAEARWLLPMLCRAGKIGKDAIGAIRVQQTETLVELAEAAVPGFLAAIGADGVLEDGVTARRVEGGPDGARPAPAPVATPAARPAPVRAETPVAPPKAPEVTAPEASDPKKTAPEAARPEETPAAAAATPPPAPQTKRPKDDGPRPPRAAPLGDRPARPEPRADRPAKPAARDHKPGKPGPREDRPGKPGPRDHRAAKPAFRDDRPGKPGPRDDRPGKPWSRDDRPRKDGPRAAGAEAGAPASKRGGDDRAPWQKRPPAKAHGAAEGGATARKPFRKGPEDSGKPPRAAPAKPRPSASDTSRRFEPPGGAKSGSKPGPKPGAKSGPRSGPSTGPRSGPPSGPRSGKGPGPAGRTGAPRSPKRGKD
jgi:ATP-dependent RNA helicase DeaD